MSKYIDAEKLKENFIGVYEDEINFSFDGYAIKCIDEAPTIDIDLADDGTLSVKVEDATKVTRVLVEDGKYGDLYYADRPQGEWINKHEWANGFYERECSICGAMKPILMHTAKVNFCPNCGADMREREGE